MCKSFLSILTALTLATGALAPNPSHAATLTTLVNFNGANGALPYGNLFADAKGNLFGTTRLGGAFGLGTVFEIVKTANGYAAAPTTLVSFNGADGARPNGPLIADANGNLFGATEGGGAYGKGAVFEIVKTPGGYATTPTTLASFRYFDGWFPQGGVVADANGNLFGATENGGGAFSQGTVFEIVKTADGYASIPTTLVKFRGQGGTGAGGAYPAAGLIIDATGNLFGTTKYGGIGTPGSGVVFEIKKTAQGYANQPTVLVSFDGTNGVAPQAPLIMDANGNLFGSTASTVFEILKTTDGYASKPLTLARFLNPDGFGSYPNGLLIDASGNLFGTTARGGAQRPVGYGYGTVFEIAKTADGYASAPSTLAMFNGLNGLFPSSGLIVDGSGNLIGTTSEGGRFGQPYGYGTAFEISGSGFVLPFRAFSAKLDILFGKTPSTDAFQLASYLTLAPGGNGINPVSEPVTLTVDAVTIAIPPGSFIQKAGHFHFAGAINGDQTEVWIRPTGFKRYAFTAEVRHPNLSRTNPVLVTLAIGDDRGAATVTARFHQDPGDIATK